MDALAPEQRQALHVLAFMLFRMKREESARTIYEALSSLAPSGQPDRLALAGLAAIALGKGKGAAALNFLKPVLAGKALSTRQAVFHLMKAQALWLENRKEEARSALNEYLLMTGRERNQA